MKTNDELLIEYLRVESDKIKATNKSFNEMIIANHEKRNKDSNLIAELKAEIKSTQDQLKACVNDYEEIEAENKGLKETINVDDADYNSLHDKYDALLVANGELLQSNIRLRSA